MRNLRFHRMVIGLVPDPRWGLKRLRNTAPEENTDDDEIGSPKPRPTQCRWSRAAASLFGLFLCSGCSW